MIDYIIKHIEWSLKTFGYGHKYKALCKHIRKETMEIEQSPHDLTEWVDVIILAIDGAWRAGHTPADILDALEEKQRINMNRQWPENVQPGQPSEHIREPTP